MHLEKKRFCSHDEHKEAEIYKNICYTILDGF